MRKRIGIALAWCCAAAVAQAGDGRIEINQACVAAGCFAGDPAGFPVQTAANQSYVLTSSLTVPDANTTAINLAEGATLDLGGFAILGITSCGASPTVCTNTGTGNGVNASTGNAIRNGRIAKMGNIGISGGGFVAENLLIEQNGDYGIAGATGSVIRNCRIQLNGDDGIAASFGVGGDGAIVEGNVIRRNAGDGVAGEDLTITGNAISGNDGFGLRLNFGGGDSGYAGNVINDNNGGNGFAQGVGGVQLGTNVCGGDTTCP